MFRTLLDEKSVFMRLSHTHTRTHTFINGEMKNGQLSFYAAIGVSAKRCAL